MNQFSIRQITLQLAIIALLLMTAACSHRNYLIVDYQVPAETQTLSGQRVRIQVKDMREDTKTLTPAAAAEFPHFEERYSLSWVKESNLRISVGQSDLTGLFQEAFQKRLTQMGAFVVPADESSAPLFQIIIQTMKIDLKDHTWTAKVAFEASLFMDNQLVAKETVNGSAERPKIIGRKGADDTLSDIFTDIINRLNIIKLFQQAKLI
ncbi:MAG: hypothetical protein M0036_05475 [Desulfobacteraceae bacterium]|nr:hypothetical protein [Desulfobacteraceae bacterium]